MKSSDNSIIRLLVLVPHRDSRRVLRAYGGKLFHSGVFGARSFPPVAPLAVVSQSLSRETLLKLAKSLRNRVNHMNREGAFATQGWTTVSIPSFPPLGGLNLALPPLEFEPSLDIRPLIPSILGLTILGSTDTEHHSERFFLEKLEKPLSFRAAALANFLIRPLPYGARDFSFEWEIGKLAWLPSSATV